MDPQKSAGRIQRGARPGAAVVWDPLDLTAVPCRAPPCALSVGRGPQPVRRGGEMSGRVVGGGARVPTSLACLAASGPRDRRALRGHLPLGVSSTGRDWATVSSERSLSICVRLAGCMCGFVASLSALHPTRLETRTKESNMRASHWVVRNPKAQ